MTDATARLRRVPLFSELEPSHLESVARLLIEFDAPAGHVLMQPGMVGAGLFLIDEGTVRLSIKEEDIELGPGEVVGELALLDDSAVHTGRVQVKTPVRGYCITRDDFETLLESEPRIALPMLKVLASRLVDVVTRR